MNRQDLPTSLIATAFAALFTVLPAAHGQTQQEAQMQAQYRVYGSQLMTPQERWAHRNEMLSARTPQERERIRAEHHRRMQARAQEHGLVLPEAPPSQGGGMGPGRSFGGMGPGGGMGGRR